MSAAHASTGHGRCLGLPSDTLFQNVANVIVVANLELEADTGDVTMDRQDAPLAERFDRMRTDRGRRAHRGRQPVRRPSGHFRTYLKRPRAGTARNFCCKKL